MSARIVVCVTEIAEMDPKDRYVVEGVEGESRFLFLLMDKVVFCLILAREGRKEFCEFEEKYRRLFILENFTFLNEYKCFILCLI